MLGSEELKQLAKSVKTFENTKINLEESEKTMFHECPQILAFFHM